MAGGNQVFQVVVDTDDIATQISGLLYREKVLGLPHRSALILTQP